MAAITETIIRLLAYIPPGTCMHMMRSSLSWTWSQSNPIKAYRTCTTLALSAMLLIIHFLCRKKMKFSERFSARQCITTVWDFFRNPSDSPKAFMLDKHSQADKSNVLMAELSNYRFRPPNQCKGRHEWSVATSRLALSLYPGKGIFHIQTDFHISLGSCECH